MTNAGFSWGADSNYYELQKIQCYLLFFHVYGIGHKPLIYIKESVTREICRVVGRVSHEAM